MEAGCDLQHAAVMRACAGLRVDTTKNEHVPSQDEGFPLESVNLDKILFHDLVLQHQTYLASGTWRSCTLLST